MGGRYLKRSVCSGYSYLPIVQTRGYEYRYIDVLRL